MPQALAVPRVKADSSGLTFPKSAVSPSLGKNSATDSPICALAERSSCSASRTSGLRSNNDEGKPGGTFGGASNAWVVRTIGPGTRPKSRQSSFSVLEIWSRMAGIAAAASASAASAREASNADAVPPATRWLKILRLSVNELVVRPAISNSRSSSNNRK